MTADLLPVEYACALDGRGGAKRLSASELSRWQPADGVLWADLNLTHAHSKTWLTRHGGTDEAVLDILLAGETRPRMQSSEHGLVLVLRGVNLNPGADPEDMVAVRIWIGDERIITSRRRRVLSVGDLQTMLEKGEGPKSPSEFIVMLVSRLGDRIGVVVEKIEDEVQELDARVMEDEVTELRRRLGDLRREVASIRRFVAPQRDALERVYRQPGPFVPEAAALDIREEADRLTRFVEDLDLAREHALVVQEELLNRVAQEQNQRMYLLSVIAAIFLPLTFVTGLLGMNVTGLPGTRSPNGFIVSALVMVGLGIGLTLFFKWRKWI